MTIAVDAQRAGFVPTRTYAADMVRRYPVTLNSNQALFMYDAVTLINGVAVPVTAGLDPASPLAGVVVGLADSNEKPLTFSQPTRGPFITSGQSGFADVLIDPNMTFKVRYEGSVGNNVVGKNVQVTAGLGDINAGRSGQGVEVAASASTGLLFKVVNLSPFEQLSSFNAGRGTNKFVEVIPNRHFLKSTGTPDT
jgi:PPE-repeat protein